jgi:hypothetical protein
MSHGTANEEAVDVEPAKSSELQLVYIALGLLSLVLYIQASPELRGMPAWPWPILLLGPAVIFDKWLKKKKAVRGHSPTEQEATGTAPVPQQAHPAPEAPSGPVSSTISSETPPVQHVNHAPEASSGPALHPNSANWELEVDTLKERYPNRFKFKLSPLVYAPESDALRLIDARFPGNSGSAATDMYRQIILLGRERCFSAPDCIKQKVFAGHVLEDLAAQYAARGLTKPVISLDSCCRILAGTYSTSKFRQIPSKAVRQKIS